MVKKISNWRWEINDIPAFFGYVVISLTTIKQFGLMAVDVIPLDTLSDLITGTLFSSTAGNLTSVFVAGALLFGEKYYRYGMKK